MLCFPKYFSLASLPLGISFRQYFLETCSEIAHCGPVASACWDDCLWGQGLSVAPRNAWSGSRTQSETAQSLRFANPISNILVDVTEAGEGFRGTWTLKVKKNKEAEEQDPTSALRAQSNAPICQAHGVKNGR